jgi:hypothetical protein
MARNLTHRHLPHLKRSLVRCLIGLAVVPALVLGATACRATRTLSQRELVVHFQLNTTLAERARVARACERLPLASPEPLPDSRSAAAKLDELRFRIDKAPNATVDGVARCAQHFPSVRYLEEPSDS